MRPPPHYNEMKEMQEESREVVQAGKEIYERGLVAGTWGNISRRLEEDKNKFAVTPSGMDYGEIEEDDIVIMNLDGEKIDGTRRPSTETPLHRHIYQARDDAKAIVHTHSTYASAVACTRIDIPPIVEDMVQIVGGTVKIADYRLPGTEELAEAAVDALGERNAVLLANHGAVSLGEDMTEALKVAEIVEKSAKILILAETLEKPQELSEDDVEKMRKMYLEEYGQT